MKLTYTLVNYLLAILVVGLFIAWRADRTRLNQQVGLLEQKLALWDPDWKARRLAIDKIKLELDEKFDQNTLPLLLFALTDHDPVVRLRALDALEGLRMDARTMNLSTPAVNSQPELAFWVGVIVAARQHSDSWEQIRSNIERLNRGVPELPSPFE